MSATATLDRTLTLPELAQAWGWSPAKLYRLVEVNAIPHLRIRGRIYFELSALEQWKSAHRQGFRVAAETSLPAGARTRAQECEALGIPVDHEFS